MPAAHNQMLENQKNLASRVNLFCTLSPDPKQPLREPSMPSIIRNTSKTVDENT